MFAENILFWMFLLVFSYPVFTFLLAIIIISRYNKIDWDMDIRV
jgi:hypothetical protein